jgi:hypothetical protein
MVLEAPAVRPLLERFRNRNNIKKRRENSLKVQKHYSMWTAEAYCSTRQNSSDALAPVLTDGVLTSQAQKRAGRLVSSQSQQFQLLNKTKVR